MVRLVYINKNWGSLLISWRVCARQESRVKTPFKVKQQYTCRNSICLLSFYLQFFSFFSGYACRLLTPEMKLLICGEETLDVSSFWCAEESCHLFIIILKCGERTPFATVWTKYEEGGYYQPTPGGGEGGVNNALNVRYFAIFIGHAWVVEWTCQIGGSEWLIE